MQMQELDELNGRAAIAGELTFVQGPEGSIIAEIENRHASAKVSLVGAHVYSFIPKGHDPVIWMSPKAAQTIRTMIHGGIPFCFPWFADHPTDKKKPLHGFAHQSVWNVSETESLADGRTRILFSLKDNNEIRKLWSPSFIAELTVIVGEQLDVSVRIRNTDNSVMKLTDALHSYFNVGDVSDIVIKGLDGVEYIDKTDNFMRKRQKGDIVPSSETNRIYLDTQSDCVISDKRLKRDIYVKKTGSRTTVVWNPWLLCEKIPDMNADSYRTMICVETANTENDSVILQPGGEHRFSVNISVKKTIEL
jgi:glucose-6-phosphate 1-epimerase